MNIVLCGQKYFGQAVLELLLEMGHRVVLVSSPAWRNERLEVDDRCTGPRDRLHAEAERLRIRWVPSGWMSVHSIPDGVDLIVAAHSHDFIPRAVRERTRLGAIGYHPSLLPLHRGRDAVRWAVKMRERVTGGSIYWLTDQVDGGPVAAQGWCFIRPDDTPETLWRRDLQALGLRLFRKVLEDIESGTLVRIPQDESMATWEPAFGPPPLHRPDLPQIGCVPGYEVRADAEAWAKLRLAMYR